jgi:hypothetical protein
MLKTVACFDLEIYFEIEAWHLEFIPISWPTNPST